MSSYVQELEQISLADIERCGGKAAGLGELIRLGVRVPSGFCVVGDAFEYVVEENELNSRIDDIVVGLDFEDYGGVEEKTAEIRALLLSAELPSGLKSELQTAFGALIGDKDSFVAVRSSVAVKNSDVSSFPGMMDTFHYVLGESEVITKIRECWASVWTARAAFARQRKGLDHDRVVIAPVVQIMVDADRAGVMFTANPVNKDTSEIVIESNWGIGETVVSGISLNDYFVLDKASFAIKEQKIAEKSRMVSFDTGKGSGRSERPVAEERVAIPTLDASQLAKLGEAASRIQDHFNFEADIEWAFLDGELYILQTRRIRGLET